MTENNFNNLKNISEEQNNSTPEGNSYRQPEEIETPETLKTRIAALEKDLDQFKEQLLRKAAEFENYKKRVEGEYADRIRFANEDLLIDLLPVIDDFERSLKITRERKEFEGLYRGVDLIYQKLIRILEAQGMMHYEVVGKPFDAYYHDALLQIPRNDVPPHTVIEEVEKGYMLNDKVLRHAKVIVSGDHAVDAPTVPDDESTRQSGSQETEPPADV